MMMIYHFEMMNENIARIAAEAMRAEGPTAETMRNATPARRARVILRARQESARWGATTADLAAVLNVSQRAISEMKKLMK